jgi:potassium/chloride transporter 4/5/6
MFGWPAKKEKLIAELEIMSAISKIEKNTLICRLRHIQEKRHNKRIDLWWGGLENNGDLMLLLAHMMRMNRAWDQARIKIHSIVESDEEREAQIESLLELIESTRIEAEAEVILRPPDTSIQDIITVSSIGADLVFMGLMIPEKDAMDGYADWLIEFSDNLGSVIFVRNASRFAGSLV